MTIISTVEPEHIRQAKSGKCGFCPIAVALKAEIKRRGKAKVLQGVNVDLGSIRLTDKVARQRYVFSTPLLCQTFLSQYDLAMERGMPVEDFITRFRPFKFKLAHPLQVTQAVKHGQPKPRQSKRSLKVRVDKEGQIQAAPTIIGGIPLPMLATKKRTHGIRA